MKKRTKTNEEIEGQLGRIAMDKFFLQLYPMQYLKANPYVIKTSTSTFDAIKNEYALKIQNKKMNDRSKPLYAAAATVGASFLYGTMADNNHLLQLSMLETVLFGATYLVGAMNGIISYTAGNVLYQGVNRLGRRFGLIDTEKNRPNRVWQSIACGCVATAASWGVFGYPVITTMTRAMNKNHHPHVNMIRENKDVTLPQKEHIVLLQENVEKAEMPSTPALQFNL